MIRRELGFFALIGALTVGVDFLVYFTLANFMSVQVAISKLIGFVAGSLFAYFANRYWTFKVDASIGNSAWRFAIVYIITLYINVAVNSRLLMLLEDHRWSVQLAFLGATALSATLNFLGMKFYVFSLRPSKETE
ncbi:GtrA family protein [Pseudomonas typographi]|uniref:GtrA family protein n=1 Tax=Pseudomonas typographi TaxID=2715964 RepID=A0ABR7Z9F4_9PSED|nr:GtrA family protein [Pseudomonas typographi]MBD1553270.1 GtrA family protein [Pseudomonas typographi]MBD1602017.1 GtrA family protein [Pseudomonas typographi]